MVDNWRIVGLTEWNRDPMHQSKHLAQAIHNRSLETDDTLHVVSMISNPARYESRVRLFRRFMREMENTANVKFYVVELALGDREFQLTDENNERHLRYRTNQEIWYKENALNLAVKHLLPLDWKYLCWVDGDVSFADPEWALETCHALQHYPVVQPWRDALDLGPKGEVLTHFQSFSYVHRIRVPKQRHPGEYYKYAHSGFAWACTRKFWENVGGLMDFPILGSADHHMAWAMVGDVAASVHKDMSPAFKRKCREWQELACKVTHGDDIGYLEGRIEHHFHGPKRARKYRERWQIFIENGFDPDKDLVRDDNGLYRVVGKPGLLSDIRDYFRHRNEDSIEVG